MATTSEALATTAEIKTVEAAAAQEVAAVAKNAEGVIADAAAAVAAAQDGAQAIVEAAMTAPLAQRVTELEQDAEQWENQVELHLGQHDEALQSLNPLMALLPHLSALMTLLETPKPTPALVIPTAPSSILPNLTGQPEKVTEAVIVEPLDASLDQTLDAPAVPAPPVPRRTRVI